MQRTTTATPERLFAEATALWSIRAQTIGGQAENSITFNS
jgi:hypothetical protein